MTKCCYCLSMRTGVYLMSGFVLLELALAIFTTLTREPKQYAWDITNTSLKLMLFACFAWSLKDEKNLKARQILIFGAMIELFSQFILGLGGLINVHFSDDVKDWCLNKAQSENWMYDSDYNLVTQDGEPAYY